ncbi:MAG: site-specific integrase, partial [Acidimicrobiales bacterium]
MAPELVPSAVVDTVGATASPERLAALEAKVAAAITRGRAAATLRAYRSDWADLSTWCRTVGVAFLPAHPGTVASYVAELADPPDDRLPAAVSTITRRLAAIGAGHKVAGHPNPCTDQLVRETMKGIRRMLGVAPRQKKGVSTADVRAAVAPLGSSLLDTRDRLILLLGFAGAMRRSELVGLDVDHVEEVDEGLLVHLGRSKTDQEGRGRRVEVVYGSDAATCPVRAWRAWLATAGIAEGPVLRPVDRHGRLGAQRLSAQAVGMVVKRHMARLGYRSADFAGHSLRRG